MSEAEHASQELVNSETAPGVKKSLQFKDKLGEPITVDYFTFPQTNEHAFDNHDLKEVMPGLMDMARKAFPNYDENGYTALEQKFDKAKALDIVRRQDGTVIGFHIFKVDEIDGYSRPLKTMYVDHAATDPEFEGRGITTGARKVIYGEEQPDVFCGSSANPAVYVSNKRIAENGGWSFYPTEQETPKQMYDLAHAITQQMGITNAQLDERLVRTYDGPVSRGKGEHPLAPTLHLGPTQHVFYMGVKPTVASEILAA